MEKPNTVRSAPLHHSTHTFPSDTAALRTVTGHMGTKHCFSRLVTVWFARTESVPFGSTQLVRVCITVLIEGACQHRSLKLFRMYVIHPKLVGHDLQMGSEMKGHRKKKNNAKS